MGGSKKNVQRGTHCNSGRGEREGLYVRDIDAFQPELSSLENTTCEMLLLLYARSSSHPDILREGLFRKERCTKHLGTACEFRTGLPLRLAGHLLSTRNRQMSLWVTSGSGEGEEKQIPFHDSALHWLTQPLKNEICSLDKIESNIPACSILYTDLNIGLSSLCLFWFPQPTLKSTGSFPHSSSRLPLLRLRMK